ncbi:methyltransferase family protein [Lutibacter sp. Hel_I_33_5]|uniref:class I SAM-dependent methyltransferase n=1 Tax=Lutibacter sp. Hel_I_33_5 TaxID=1566289 RepID=UPI0011A1FCA1|nr:class I SAM-dependent methyltransferase [Lutibacter sp. Hel_I_33_5]TVZ56195.1 methyltransferase family protein [Lutibacter sp. Hel_I_33_5]
MTKQGKEYIKKDADKWYERNCSLNHNCFTSYFVDIMPRNYLINSSIAEFGVGRGNNIRFLSNYAKQIDGYDGSKKSILNLKNLKKSIENIDGKHVDLGDQFESLRKYDVIIFGFFTYMLSNEEFNILLNNTKQKLKKGGYIFIYDFLTRKMIENEDFHNKKFKVYKRNLDFYIQKLNEFNLQDFRLWDNRKLKNYLFQDKISLIDSSIENNDYNWTFSGLFKLK